MLMKLDMKDLVDVIKENLEEIILEGYIGTTKYITVFTSNHTDDRMSQRNILIGEIRNTINNVFEKIDRAIQNKSLDIGSRFTIKNHKNNINLPCSIRADEHKSNKNFIRSNGVNQNYIIIDIITDYLGANFKNYKSDYVIDIY